jgi:MFS family permease
MSGIISADPFMRYFPETYNNATWQGFVTAIYEIGCLIGAIGILCFGDALGRRRGMMIGAFIMILGVIIQCTSIKGHKATAQFIIGRVVTGIGNGMNTSTIPTYQAECSNTKNRGLLICIEGGVIAFGTLIAYWVDFGCAYGPDELTWRFPIAFQIVFGLIVLIAPVWLPESPRWLLTKDRQEEASKVIAALRGYSIHDDETKLQVNVIMDGIRASGHAGGVTPFSSLFKGGKTQHFRRMMIGASSQLFQQIGVCIAILPYMALLTTTGLQRRHLLLPASL